MLALVMVCPEERPAKVCHREERSDEAIHARWIGKQKWIASLR